MKRNDEAQRFWITCPKCQHRFGVSKKLVLKYMNRLLDSLTERIEESSKRIQKEERGA